MLLEAPTARFTGVIFSDECISEVRHLRRNLLTSKTTAIHRDNLPPCPGCCTVGGEVEAWDHALQVLGAPGEAVHRKMVAEMGCPRCLHLAPWLAPLSTSHL